jgi:hypothetical protein
MKRPGVAAALFAAFLVSGCAAQQAVFRPAGDPDELTAAIARSGWGEGEARAEPPGPSSWNEHMKTAEEVGLFCACLPVYILYAVAKGVSAGPQF